MTTAQKCVQSGFPLNMFNDGADSPSIEHIFWKCPIECSGHVRMNMTCVQSLMFKRTSLAISWGEIAVEEDQYEI
jgi:hypothetical protein